LRLEKAFVTTWHLGLLHKLSTLKFIISLIKLIGYYLSQRKFEVSVGGEMSAPRNIQAGYRKVLSCPAHCTVDIRINDTPRTPGVYLGLFADDTTIYATDRREGYVLRKLPGDLSAIQTGCEGWNTKMSGDKTQAIYFSHRLRPPEAHLTLNGWKNPLVNHVKYLGVILYKRITWRLHLEMIETKAFSAFNKIYSLLKSERLRAKLN
jgi:hypothetical protein